MTNDNPQGLGDWQSSGFKRLTILRVWETDNPQGLRDWQSSGFGRLTIPRVWETDNPQGLGDWQSSGLGRLTILGVWETDNPRGWGDWQSSGVEDWQSSAFGRLTCQLFSFVGDTRPITCCSHDAVNQVHGWTATSYLFWFSAMYSCLEICINGLVIDCPIKVMQRGFRVS